MALIHYPIAADVQSALKAGVMTATRETEAETLAGAHVVFASEWVGPAYADRDSALAGWVGRLEDDRDGHAFNPPPEDRFCKLICRMATLGEKKRARAPAAEPVWQVSVSYWKIMAAPRHAVTPAKDQARKLRKSSKGSKLTSEDVQGLVEAPLQPYRLQKGLDFGLFDFIPPDNPNIVIADE